MRPIVEEGEVLAHAHAHFLSMRLDFIEALACAYQTARRPPGRGRRHCGRRWRSWRARLEFQAWVEVRMRMATGSFSNGPLIYGLCCGRQGISGCDGKEVLKGARGLLV